VDITNFDMAFLEAYKKSKMLAKCGPISKQCLTESEVVDYVYGILSENEQEKIKSHIQQCSYCSSRVFVLQIEWSMDLALENIKGGATIYMPSIEALCPPNGKAVFMADDYRFAIAAGAIAGNADTKPADVAFPSNRQTIEVGPNDEKIKIVDAIISIDQELAKRIDSFVKSAQRLYYSCLTLSDEDEIISKIEVKNKEDWGSYEIIISDPNVNRLLLIAAPQKRSVQDVIDFVSEDSKNETILMELPNDVTVILFQLIRK